MNPPLSPSRRIVTVTEDDGDLDLDALLIDDSLSESHEGQAVPPIASWSPRPTLPIKAIEEDIDTKASEWILPPPSQPGDFLTNSLHRVPSKSILKKTSSYGNFDMNESISSSKRGMKKKSSFLSFDVSVNSGAGSVSASKAGSEDYGLDLDSSSQSQMSTSFLRSVRGSSSSLTLMNTPETATETMDASNKSSADEAAGTMDTSLSTSAKMRRNVSFNAVNVREYDRTVGDNVRLFASAVFIYTKDSYITDSHMFLYILQSTAIVQIRPAFIT